MLLIIALAGCNKDCNCYNDFTPLPLSEKYFKYYRDEKQSWVYINQDGTKKDSIFLTYDWNNPQKGQSVDVTSCNIFYTWKTILHSNFILKDTVLCEYSSAGVKRKDIGVLWWNTFFIFQTRSNSDQYWGCISKYGVDTMQIGAHNKIFPYKPETLKLPNNLVYNDVISIENKLWFAPDVGLVQFVSYNKVDTFYLQKFNRK